MRKQETREFQEALLVEKKARLALLELHVRANRSIGAHGLAEAAARSAAGIRRGIKGLEDKLAKAIPIPAAAQVAQPATLQVQVGLAFPQERAALGL